MEKFKSHFLDTKLQPQIFSMIVVTLILVVMAIVIYSKVKNQKINQAPKGTLLVAEQYVMGMNNLFDQATGGKLTKPGPYIFTLMTFLTLANLIGLAGLDEPTASYSVTLTLGLVAWIGIYVVGLVFQKLRFFRRYLNPLEMVSQIAPLISISFRLFGNTIGGSTVMYLLYHVSGYIWGFIPVVGEMNLLGSMIAPVFHVYFSIFDGVIQAFVFTLLTMIYWVMEAQTPEPKKIKKELASAKIKMARA